MSKNLVIVESPAKAKTIKGYLGKDFQVESSYGHIRDLPKDDEAIDKENGFLPKYIVSKDKTEVIKKLKKESENSDLIYLATDDDREGEAISWHIKEELKLEDAKVRRIVFREITRNAILNAIKDPRGINIDLVNAQQARRVLDRLVGFELSPVLWKKIKTGLSAGRVQSVAVRLVVERERDIEKFKIEHYFKVVAWFLTDKGKTIKAELSEKFKHYQEAREFLENCRTAVFTVGKLEKKPTKKSPSPPFTTSTLQQEASRKLGYSVSQTMVIAQRLYESGKISYMRTDSLNLSQEAIGAAKSEITETFGMEYSKPRQYKTKSSSAQEAHEAIRPTDFSVQSIDGDRRDQRLYELIWKRAIASQMTEAEIEKTIVTIHISDSEYTFTASGEVVIFDGFLKIYMESSDEENEENKEDLIPPLKKGEVLAMKQITARQTFTRPPYRYTEASLVKKLEELGIGRPSTYAPTISTILKRNYVSKDLMEGKERQFIEMTLEKNIVHEVMKSEVYGSDKNKLSPTNTGKIVNDFLVDQFPNIFDYSFTANIEKQFDDISQGLMPWNTMIERFYREFRPLVEDSEKLTRAKVGSVRELGLDPVSGKKVYARLARFGPIIQLGEGNGDIKPKFAAIPKGHFIDSITLEEAMELFKLPRTVGQFHGKEIIAGIGKFGPFIRYENKFISLADPDDPLEINEERAIELIEHKSKTDSEKIIKNFSEDPETSILNGRYGPYIKMGKKNLRIPKGKDPASLTYEDCLEISKNAPEKKRGGKRKTK